MKKYIYFLIITLALEIFVSNFGTLKSLGYKETDLTEYSHAYETTVYIENIDMDIKNIRLSDTGIKENEPITYSIGIIDEGNKYIYNIGSRTLSYSAESSFIRDINAYGNVKTMEIYFDVDAQPDFGSIKITANVKKPFNISILRMIVIYLLLVFIFALRSDLPMVSESLDLKNKKHLIITLAVLLITLIWGFYWSSSHVLLNEASKPHQQQYKELADVLLSGNVKLPDEPSEGLLNAENPYDTIALQAEGIDYKADYAFYNGSYYIYFGIVPELLLYLPVHALTGKDLPNHYAVFAFYALFAVGIFLLYSEIIKRYKLNTGLVPYLMLSALTSICGPMAYLYFTADLYSVPIIAAFAFTVVGLFFWMRGLGSSKEALCYALGSLSMAMVAGCRPQILIFSLLAIPIFWDKVIKERELFSKKSIGRTIAICLPYALVAALVMWYNYARFGSVFDFGATYSLTNNDMNLRGFSLKRMLLGLWTFLFGMPNIDTVYPFLHTSTLSFDYLGKIVTEHYYGGVIVCNMITWPVFLMGLIRKDLKERKLLVPALMLVGGSLIIGLLDANSAGVLQRYASDMSLGILLASGIVVLAAFSKLSPKIENSENNTLTTTLRSRLFGIFKLIFIFTLIYALMIIFNADGGITLKHYNPELYYRIGELLRL